MKKGPYLRLVFGKTAKALERLDRESIGHTGLKVTDFTILEALLHKGPMAINTIGEKVLLTSGSMTAAADRLEKRGLVQRTRCPEDGRRFNLHLTGEGMQLIRRAYGHHRDNLNRLFSCLDADEQQEFVRLLKKIGTHAEQLEIGGDGSWRRPKRKYSVP